MVLQDKYVNPLTDFGFKKLFGSEPNKELLIDFLNTVLPDKQIKELSYSSTEKLGKYALDRKAIFDLYCIGENGERFIVEMQKAKQNFFKDRTVFYSSFSIQEQGKRQHWDYRLDPVYAVGILDFEFDDHKEEEELLHVIELKNQRCEVFYDKLKFIYIELPKFTKEESELETHFDKWLYIFRHLSELQDRPKALQDRIFARLFEAAEIAKYSPKEQKAYEDSLKYHRDLKNVIDTSKEEGIQEGMEKGLEKGREEKSLEIARQMKKEGLSANQIVRMTGLSSEEIEQL